MLELCEGRGRHVVLQPVVDLRDGHRVLVEGLSRFAGAERDPAQWFAAADRVGLGRRLEIAAARDVLERARVRRAAPLVSINLSPGVVLDGGMPEVLRGFQPEEVVVEVTEHLPVPSYERMQRVLQPSREAGLQVAVDDAGAGWSSLQHILKLRPDYIKVDASMAAVRELGIGSGQGYLLGRPSATLTRAQPG